MKLQKGQTVQLLPVNELLEVFRNRGFFLNDETRQRYANDIGGKHGLILVIEDKYADDYFFFQPFASDHVYSIPSQSVTNDQIHS